MAAKIEDCDCGFIDVEDSTQGTFTSLLAVDFTSATTKDLDNIFITATYNVTQPDTPFVRDFLEDQVRLTNRGLELTVSPSSDGKTIPSAAIFSRASTFSFGSYRARFLVGRVPGTVTAFYNYKNDSSEVDIEYVSARDPALLYSTKPQLYGADGNALASTLQQDIFNGTVADFDDNFHEWSFLWLPDVVHYGLDSNSSKSITTNVPRDPGRIALSHWSNGDPNYSEGPPSQNSTVVAKFFQAVYNDTNAKPLECKRTATACRIRDGVLVPPGSTTSTSGGGGGSSGANSGGSSGITEGGVTAATTTATVLHVNSAHGLSPVGPSWLLLLAILLFWRCR